MARQERISFSVPDAVGPGSPQIVDRHTDKTLLVTVAALGGGTLNVLGSLDGATFFQVGTTISTAGFVTIAETLKSMRIDRASGNSTGVSVDLIGFDQRTV